MKRLLLPVLAAALAGCTSVGRPDAVWIDRTEQVTLPAPHCAKEVEFTELLSVEYKDRKDKMLAHVRCRGDVMEVIGMLPVGARLFTIVQEKDAVRVTRHMPLTDTVAPQQILWEIHAAHFTAGLEGKLPPGYQLKEQGNVKTLVNSKGEAVERIVYSENDPVSIENVPFGYRITIKKLR